MAMDGVYLTLSLSLEDDDWSMKYIQSRGPNPAPFWIALNAEDTLVATSRVEFR